MMLHKPKIVLKTHTFCKIFRFFYRSFVSYIYYIYISTIVLQFIYIYISTMEMDGIGTVWTENIRPKTLLEFARFYPLNRTFFNTISTIFRPTCFICILRLLLLNYILLKLVQYPPFKKYKKYQEIFQNLYIN